MVPLLQIFRCFKGFFIRWNKKETGIIQDVSEKVGALLGVNSPAQK
jgi:hypothetical protein